VKIGKIVDSQQTTVDSSEVDMAKLR
jgi:hypothetical protein